MRDLPSTFDPKLTWHIIWDHRRFEFQFIDFYDYRLAMYIQAHETTNRLPNEWHNEEVEAQIEFLESSEGVKS